MKPGTVLLCTCGAVAAGAVPFFVKITAWPEVLVPAYFMTRGARLYDSIFFPHTPLLISLLAAAGRTFGFSAGLLRSVVAAAMATTAVLAVLGMRGRRGFPAGAAVAVFLSVLWLAYLDGLAVWPDALLTPVVLGAGLLLERGERPGSGRWVAAAGLLLGVGILIKQTSAWIPMAAMAWLIFRRQPARRIGEFATGVVLPYAAFTLVWGVAFRTTAHLTWTLVLPLATSHGREIRVAPALGDLHESIAPFLMVASFVLLEHALGRRRTGPLPFLAAGTIGMAWPRAGLLHLSAATGVIAILGARSLLSAGEFFRRGLREKFSLLALVSASVSVALLVASLGVAAVAGGSVLADGWKGTVYYWDDSLTAGLLAEVRARLTPDRRVFLFNVPRDTLYVRAGAVTPDGIYVNSGFWYYLEREGLDHRVTEGLRNFRGWILFRDLDPDQEELKKTELYRYLEKASVVHGRVGNDLSWRLIER